MWNPWSKAENSPESVADSPYLETPLVTEHSDLIPVDQHLQLSAAAVERLAACWQCVSLSEQQFNTHYVYFTEKLQRVLQTPEVIEQALDGALSRLQKTLITREPVGRDREEGAHVEQLWRYAVFVSALLAGVRDQQRSFFDAGGKPLAFLQELQAACYYDLNGMTGRYFLPGMLPSLFSDVSLEWFQGDDGRCVMEVLKGLDYMEDRKPVRSNQRAPVPVVATPPPDPVATRESGNTPVDAEGESSSTTPAELMSALISWSEKAQGADVLQDENALFIGSPAGIAQFIEESTVVTSIAQVQKALLESGAIKVKKTVNKKSVNGYQLEAAHV